ncbi:MAG: hypothetical protein IPN01_38570 [Deltaproteobacteria bacterium]|nr:hypothetical protein [Deltaproteobacteria bacterium]
MKRKQRGGVEGALASRTSSRERASEDDGVGVQLKLAEQAPADVHGEGVLDELIKTGVNRGLAEPVGAEVDLVVHAV